MPVTKKHLSEEIKSQAEKAQAHFTNEMNGEVVNGLIRCVFTQRISARKYEAGWRFTKIGTPVGDVQMDCHAVYDRRQEIVWVAQVDRATKETEILKAWPTTIRVEFMGKVETWTRLGGVGHFPYDCVAKDRYPDAVCYQAENGGWLGNYDMVEVSPGFFRYWHKVM